MVPKNRKLKNFHWILVSILLISAMLYSASTLPTCSAAETGPAKVFVDPPENVFKTATVGTSFEVNVTIANTTGIAGVQFTLSWNASLLVCTSIQENLYHRVMPADSWGNIFNIKLTKNNTKGTADYAQAFLNNEEARQGGYGPINITTANYTEGKLACAVLTFNITHVPPQNTYAECNFTLSDVIVGDMAADEIPVTLVNGHYRIYGPPETVSHNVVVDGTTYVVTTASNATVVPDSMTFVGNPNWTLSFNLTGADGSTGYVNVTIPKLLLSLATPTDEWNVTVNEAEVTPTVSENDTHWFLYLATGLSTKSVTIIGTVPEFTLMVIPLLMVVTLIAIGLRRRKRI